MAGVVALDLATGPELSTSIFFLVPVGFTAWYTYRTWSVLTAFACAALWFLADRLSGTTYSHPMVPVWNAVVRLGFFLTVALLLLALRKALHNQEELAIKDPLTGVANLRHFSSALAQEVERANRYKYPTSVAYLDLDDFKSINDLKGHHVGDDVLRSIAKTIAGSIRSSDLLGRIGGDEFALLLPETNSDDAVVVVAKLQAALRTALGEGITLSVGCTTYSELPNSIDTILSDSDRLMYEAKRAGKNRMIHQSL